MKHTPPCQKSNRTGSKANPARAGITAHQAYIYIADTCFASLGDLRTDKMVRNTNRNRAYAKPELVPYTETTMNLINGYLVPPPLPSPAHCNARAHTAHVAFEI